MIDQVSVFLENKSGRLAKLAQVLGDAGIDMHALMVADTTEFGVVRIICDRPLTAKRSLEDAGFGAVLTPVMAVAVNDEPGGLANVLHTLDRSGNNVEYAYCFVEPSEFAVDILKVDSPDAEQVLLDAGFRVLDAAALYAPDEV